MMHSLSIIDQTQPVHYLPIATTIVSAAFFAVLVRRYLMTRSGPHLLWWAAGIFAYGLGTSAITLAGNSMALNKSWYIAGALLGGYPLAQGTVFLLLSRRTAMTLTMITVPFIAVTALLVALSPVDYAALEAHRPSGAILQWQWVRLMTPFINSYAALFLIGGAILSAARYARVSRASFASCLQCDYTLFGLEIIDGYVACPECSTINDARVIGLFGQDGARDQESLCRDHANRRSSAASRAIGNGLIAFGAMLPAIGGGMAKLDVVEPLYIGEFVGLLFIWAGYAACVRRPGAVNYPAPATD